MLGLDDQPLEDAVAGERDDVARIERQHLLVPPEAGTPPEARFRLQGGDFLRIGERIAHLGLPTAFILEGGDAAPELGTHIVNVLEGFETATE